jgi:hypothetical protein
MSHIFISYSRKDTACVEQFVRALQMQGFTVWQDTADIRGGNLWKTKISYAIRDCAAFVVFWSQHSQASKWVAWEIEQIQVRENIAIIPVCLEDIDLTAPLSGDIQRVDAVGCHPSGIAQLIRALPAELRWQITSIDPDKTLSEQGATPADLSSTLQAADLVSLPLVQAQQCKAVLIGSPGAKLRERSTVQVALHFTRRIKEPFLSQVNATLTDESENNQNPDSLFAIYVTGYADAIIEDDYRLNDDNPAQWMEAANTAFKAVNHVLGDIEPKPTLQVFGALPAALAFQIGRMFDKYYRVQVYNYVLPPASQAPYYKLVIDTPPLR